MSLTERAPAKVNLFLHVGAPRADGRHPVCSLAVFADVGDLVEARAAPRSSLDVSGPFAGGVGRVEDNLITRALAAAGAPPLAVWLDKRLPVASGLGGGSSDAGAALRLVRRIHPEIAEEALERGARATGADGLLCYRAAPSIAEGQGDILWPAPAMPALPTVLVNPRVACPTGEVYRAYDAGPGTFQADRPAMPACFPDVAEVARFLAAQRNDLEAPAVALRPVIQEALDALAGRADALIVRMSGSGATIFGLFPTDFAARAAAVEIARLRPAWWVQACRLNPA